MEIKAGLEMIEISTADDVFLGKAFFRGVNSDTGEAIIDVFYGRVSEADEEKAEKAALRIRKWIMECRDRNRVV